jgi:hypothetical protein
MPSISSRLMGVKKIVASMKQCEVVHSHDISILKVDLDGLLFRSKMEDVEGFNLRSINRKIFGAFESPKACERPAERLEEDSAIIMM